MWVIFLLAAMSVAICAFIVVYIGHRVIMRIEKERKQNSKPKRKTNNNKTERGNKK